MSIRVWHPCTGGRQEERSDRGAGVDDGAVLEGGLAHGEHGGAPVQHPLPVGRQADHCEGATRHGEGGGGGGGRWRTIQERFEGGQWWGYNKAGDANKSLRPFLLCQSIFSCNGPAHTLPWFLSRSAFRPHAPVGDVLGRRRGVCLEPGYARN